ncbi:hypothetical protein GQ53DRAFT_8384 [Thozetella sp. PMI_491]|nr:hypothetical protein GQ53DRAFT_8384 [Thozetella sp. PMI_491]
MSSSNAITSERGDGEEKCNKNRVAIRVHSHFFSQRELSEGLSKTCTSGPFKVEMRHNTYMIYPNKDDVDAVISMLSKTYQMDRREAEDTSSDASDVERRLSVKAPRC